MVTPLEESILAHFYRLTLALRDKRNDEAKKIHEAIQSLLEKEPFEAELFGEFLLMNDTIYEEDYDYETVVRAYNDLAYEFKKQKYPERYKD
jgi:hypothetical protein